MENLKYSIIVPIYKVEDYLNECINSLINQSYRNIEIILVDDGSPDNCPKICDEYAKKDKRIKVVHKTNGGLVNARKAGCSEITGNYVFSVDGDDYISLNAVAKVNEIIEKYQCDIVCFGYYTGVDFKKIVLNGVDGGFYTKDMIINNIYPSLIESEKGKYFPNNIVNKVFKKEIYIKEQQMVDDSVKIGEDLACTKPIIAKVNSLYVLNDCLYYYRVNVNSMTKDRKPFKWNGPELIYNHLKNRLNEVNYDFYEQICRNTVHNIFNVAMSQFFDKDRTYKQIKKEILKHLENPNYKEVIYKAKYKKTFSRKFMVYALKHRLIFLLKIYSMYKKF